MDEPPKEAGSSVKPKDKTLFFPDERFGKDFLTSLKSTSATEDDVMNFQFETGTKGKKKAFNFENMDVDFSLDTDFGKLSSFKVDMPDLDFSPVPKNTGKSTKISTDSRSGKLDERNDHLSFSFDFDDFNFDSSPVKENKSKKSESKGITLDKSADQDSWNQPSDDITEFGNSITNPSNSETIPNQVLFSGDKKLDVITKKSVAEESDIHKAVSTEPPVKQATQRLPVLSASANNPIQPTFSKLSTQICLPDKTEEIIHSGGGQTVNVMNGNDPKPNLEKLLPKESPSPPLTRSLSCCSDDNVNSRENAPLGITNGTKPFENLLDVEVTSVGSISAGILHEKADQENNNSNSKFASSGLNGDRKLRQQTPGVVHSRFFKRLEETESHVRQITPNSAKNSSEVKTVIGTMPLNPSELQRNEIKSDIAKHGTKVNPRSSGRDLTKCEPRLVRIEKNPKDLGCIERVSSNSTFEKPRTSLLIPEAGKKLLGSVSPNISLKRKTFEDLNVNKAIKNPPKCLPGTVNESRKTTRSSEILSDKPVCSNSIMVGNKNAESIRDSPIEVNVKELELTSAMVENDGRVENAEKYAKGLDDMCNMLKKKHEEAKELMVRALVTNNKLLMLNHPCYDVKLQMVQKEAAKLMSKYATN